MKSLDAKKEWRPTKHYPQSLSFHVWQLGKQWLTELNQGGNIDIQIYNSPATKIYIYNSTATLTSLNTVYYSAIFIVTKDYCNLWYYELQTKVRWLLFLWHVIIAWFSSIILYNLLLYFCNFFFSQRLSSAIPLLIKAILCPSLICLIHQWVLTNQVFGWIKLK